MKAFINNISKNSMNITEAEKFSLIGADKNEAFQLSDSKIICEVRTPSLWDSLELLRTTSDELIDKDSNSVTNMLYVNRLLIPNRENSSCYGEEIERETILKTIDELSIDDGMELQNAIAERLENHRITYSIKNVICADCGKKMEDIPVDMEDLLFTAIYEKMS
jgi:hypothetical protein